MHPNAEALSLAALGEPDPPTQSHLRGCETCRGEVDSLARVVATARGLNLQDQPRPPAPEVWARVRAEVAHPDEPPIATAPPPSPADVPAAAVDAIAVRRRPVVLAAAVGLLVGALLATTASLLAGGTDTVAEAEMVGLGTTAAGQVSLERAPDGDRVLRLELTGAPTTDRLEVWLADPELEQMVSLGYLGRGEGRLVVPAGVDTDLLSTVDVSLEPLQDADPAHSGESVARGDLG